MTTPASFSPFRRFYRRSFRVNPFIFILFATLWFVACKEGSTTDTPPVTQSVTLSKSSLPPSRIGESYAVWLEYPVSVISSANPSIPLHGTTEFVLLSKFKVEAGVLPTLDDSRLDSLPALLYAHRVLISVESDSIVGAEPKAPFIAGALTGSEHEGDATLTTSDDDALGSGFDMISASAMMWEPASSPGDYKGEFYFAKPPTATPQKGIEQLVALPLSWKYAVWSIDSGAQVRTTYLGSFTSAAGFDSQSSTDAIAFPGGRTPTDRSLPVTDLTTGSGNIIVTLEPQIVKAQQTVPFEAVILSGRIPMGTSSGVPFAVQNVSSTLPSVQVHVTR
jgi:hypothetical protein